MQFKKNQFLGKLAKKMPEEEDSFGEENEIIEEENLQNCGELRFLEKSFARLETIGYLRACRRQCQFSNLFSSKDSNICSIDFNIHQFIRRIKFNFPKTFSFY